MTVYILKRIYQYKTMQTGFVSGFIIFIWTQFFRDGVHKMDTCSVINVLWPLPCLACMSIETAFLLEVTTVSLQRWSMRPQSLAFTWANQNLMCLLRDPAVHKILLHHSKRMDGLLTWKASDTQWHGWCQRYRARDDGDGLIWKGAVVSRASDDCVCTAVSVCTHMSNMWHMCLSVYISRFVQLIDEDDSMTDEGV